MQITTLKTIDIATGETLRHEFYEYSGPVEELKKGADSAKKAAAGADSLGQTAQDTAKTDAGVQAGARSQADPFVKNLMATKPGGLSPYAQSEYQSAKVNDAQVAQDSRGMGAKAAALRGFGGTPGTNASVINTSNRLRDTNDTNAYHSAMSDTLGQGLAGVNYLGQQQQIYDPTKAINSGTNAYNAETGAAQVINTSPTLAGGIGQGLAGLAGAAGGIMTGMGGMGAKF